MSITISAMAVAWYGAIVATLSLAISAYVAIRDRTRVKVKAVPNMRVIGTGSGYDPQKSYICVTVANIGRRPVTISGVSLLRKGKKKGAYLLSDSVREGAREVSEGKSTTYLVDQGELDLDELSRVVAYDQTGRGWRGRLIREDG